MAPDTGQLVAQILNAAWMVRHYARGGRMSDPNSAIARNRQDAIRELGLIVRSALNQSDDFPALLAAVVDGLRPRNDPPF